MIRLTDYAFAYIAAILGIMFLMIGGGWIWYFIGGYLVGKGIRVAYKAGKESNN